MIRFLPVLLFVAAAFGTTVAGAEERKIKVEFDAPATNYDVKIQAVYQIGDELWVVSRVFTRGDVGGAAITRVSDEVTVDADADAPVLHKVLGKTWNWGEDTDTLQYIDVDKKEFKKRLKEMDAKLVWKRKKQAGDQ